MKKLPFFGTGFLLLALSACNGSGAKSKSADKAVGPQESSGNDVLASQAWHLNNTGQSSFAGLNGKSGEDFNIKEAIALGFKGAGVKIAVSDSGVDVAHPDLNGNALSGLHRNYSSGSSSDWKRSGVDPYPEELDAHGTAVAGLVAAEGWNTIGSRGVAPEARFAGFYYIGSFGDTASSYRAKTIDQLWGAFDIFNYSYGYLGCTFTPVDDSVVDGYKQGVLNLRGGKGAIYVKSAGNDFIGENEACFDDDDSNYLGNTNTNEDQNIPYLILTAAVNANGAISSYSTPGSGVWISSAGGEYGYTSGSTTLRKPAMVTTDLVGCSEGFSQDDSDSSGFDKGENSLNLNCDYTNSMNGTSAAAPTLSGIVALMLNANPNLSWRDVKHILAVTAQKINFSEGILAHPGGGDLTSHPYDYLYRTNAAGYSFSNTYGFGRVDALAAVQMAQTYSTDLGTYEETTNPNNNGWYYSSGVINLTIPDNDSAGVESDLVSRHNYKIESVQVSISTNHTYVGDLGVELVSPMGTRSKLLLINSNIKQSGLSNFMLLSNAFYGETSQGTWKLNVIDGADLDTGLLQNWSLKINGHKVASATDTTPPQAVSNVNSAGADLSLTTSPAITITHPNTADVMRFEVAVGNSPSDQARAKWFSVGNSTTFQVGGLSLTGGNTYYVRVRAIDRSENVSAEAYGEWEAGVSP